MELSTLIERMKLEHLADQLDEFTHLWLRSDKLVGPGEAASGDAAWLVDSSSDCQRRGAVDTLNAAI